ncbi:MAG: hypothetical protein FD167_4705 [bacterium]|nr:MAG: hypothetical protein FD167_4705 [bacterium]
MQAIAMKNTSIQLFNLPKLFVPESLLLDSNINGFEVITENNTYTFIKTEKTPDGLPKWFVIDGQQDLIGKEIEILSLSPKGLLTQAINRGDCLAIYQELNPTHTKMWYTTKVLNFSVLR